MGENFMKKLYLLLLLGLCMPAAAEMVSTISYNPSRLGQYSSLKIANSAAFLGGLYTDLLQLNGDTTMINKTLGNFYFGEILGTQNMIDMREVVFHNSSNWSSATDASNSSFSAFGSLNPTIKGGEATFEADSFIKKLTGENLLLKVNRLNTSDTLEIAGAGGAELSVGSSQNTKGFYLAGNDIPAISADTVVDYDGATQSGKTVNLADTNCKLEWVSRTTNDGQEVHVLALNSCAPKTTPLSGCTDPDGVVRSEGYSYSKLCSQVLGGNYRGHATYTCTKIDSKYRWITNTSSCDLFSPPTSIEEEQSSGSITCLKGFTWKTYTQEGSGYMANNGEWRNVAHTMLMTCNGSTAYTTCTAGKECNCTPGKYYVYYETYGCKRTEGFSTKDDASDSLTGKFGYYCALCGKVSSLSSCGAEPKKMTSKDCSQGGTQSNLELEQYEP